MKKNFFKDLQSRKAIAKQLAQNAKDFGWIDEQRMNEIITKLDNDTLVIGVIGQMKCGKSTFLNSFVFEDDILPAATTPMTAALSIIKYGEDKKIVAEFYSQEEWAEQQMQAKRDLSGITNELEISKVKAAKELVDKSHLLGRDINTYLGKTKEDTFENLIEYVGADGKYVSITKSVTIFYPKEYLKGVEIVDTPGFNDPIVSREEKTKEFLKRADTVVLMLYAGRPFDATDRDILFKNVRSCGIGKVIVGINKYDIPYGNGEKTEEIKKYVKDEISKACADCNDNSLIEILQNTNPILFSANMALLSEIPMSKISSTEEYQKAWERGCDIFEISTQNQFREHSHIDELIQAVQDMVEKEKGQILFKKPINSILAAGHKILEDTEKELKDCNTKIAVYSIPDEEIEEKQENLQKAIKRIERKITYLGDTLDEEFDNIVRKANYEMEDTVDAMVKRLNRIVDNWGRFQDYETINPQIEYEIDKLQTRDLKRCLEQQQSFAQRKLRSVLDDFFAETDEIIWKYLPDFDQKGFLGEVKRDIKFTIDDDLFKIGPSEQEESYGLGDFIMDFINGLTLNIASKVFNPLMHDDQVFNLKTTFNSISSQFDAKEYLQQSILSNKKAIIDNIKKKYQVEFLLPIQNDFQELADKSINREQILEETQQKKVTLMKSKNTITDQITDIENKLKAQA